MGGGAVMMASADVDFFDLRNRELNTLDIPLALPFELDPVERPKYESP